MAAQAVQVTQDTQKTTSQIIQTIKASAGLKTIVDALNKSAAGKVVVQLGTAFVNVVTRGQAEAVVKAQKAYDAIKDSNPESVRKWQKTVQEACRVLSGDEDSSAADGSDKWIEDRLKELEQRYPSMNARQQTIYDEMVRILQDSAYTEQYTPLEIYDTAILAIDIYENYDNVMPLGPISSWKDADSFMDGQPEVTVTYNQVIDGVLIEGREKPYTKPELESYIRTAKARGKKLDYSQYQQNADPVPVQQWNSRLTAEKIIISILSGGLFSLPGASTGASGFLSFLSPAGASASGGSVIIHNGFGVAGAAASGASAGVAIGSAISAGINYFKGNSDSSTNNNGSLKNEENSIKKQIEDLQNKTPEDLLSEGWKDVTNPKQAANTTSKELYNPRTGLRVRFDKGVKDANGFEGVDHYHIYNNNYTNKKIDYYFDVNGAPAGKGSKASHIVITGGK